MDRKRNARGRAPNFDLISTATVCGFPGVLLVEAKAHHGELETRGKAFRSRSNLANHQKIDESIAIANRALNAFTSDFKFGRDASYQASNRMTWGWRLSVARHQDRRRFLSEAWATRPLILGLMINSSTVTAESCT